MEYPLTISGKSLNPRRGGRGGEVRERPEPEYFELSADEVDTSSYDREIIAARNREIIAASHSHAAMPIRTSAGGRDTTQAMTHTAAHISFMDAMLPEVSEPSMNKNWNLFTGATTAAAAIVLVSVLSKRVAAKTRDRLNSRVIRGTKNPGSPKSGHS